MSRYVFLDIDGVLNSRGERGEMIGPDGKTAPSGWLGIARRPVELLNGLLDRTDAKLVLSSAWRLAWGLELTLLNLENAGFRHRDRFVGETPSPFGMEGRLSKRGHEIGAWLAEHSGHDSLVILDDMSPESLGPGSERLVQTSFDTGLQPEHVERALAVLACETHEELLQRGLVAA